MRILLLGCGGQVGWELQRSLAPLGEITALDVAGTARLSADFARPDELAATVAETAPDAIVNAAAYTAVDRAESEPELAHRINAVAPGVLAAAAARTGAWLVHYGTDYVFNGSGSTPRDEDAEPAPLNVYGRTKLAGEDAIRASGCRHLLLRTSWVYGRRGDNFARTVLRMAADRDKLSVVCDQIGAPTGADLLADCTAHALAAALRDPALGGTYHLVATGETSWHGYAAHVVERAQSAGVSLKATPQRVLPVPSNAYPVAAERPKNSRLDTQKFRAAFGLRLPPWEPGVDRLIDDLTAER